MNSRFRGNDKRGKISFDMPTPLTTPEFEEAYKKLNPEQKLAVDTIEGPVMVVAGPGTGKTQILTLRIANILLQTDINPENILALTFTESAVFQMRKRLVSIIGTPGYRVEISTFHGFCNEVIKQNPEDFPHLISSEAITELEQIQLIEEILDNEDLNLLRPFGDPLYYLRPALSAINELKKEGITPEDLKKAVEKQKQDFDLIEDLYYQKGANEGKMKGKYQDLQRSILKNEELLIIYQSYQKALVDQKLYDFNDMLLEVIDALKKDENLLLRLQEKYQYILVDEHQDTNAAQNKIIELLASFYEIPNLFVVGDEKQAIFRFQGASLENFLYFKKLYPSAVLINLKENYRSTQTILNAALSLISNNLSANILLENIELKANALYEENLVKVAEFSDFNAEYFWIGEKIKKLLLGHPELVSGSKRKIPKQVRNDKVDPSEVAVLGRNNRDLLPLMEILEDMEIPFALDSDASILNDPYVKRMIYILRAVDGLGNDAELVRALHIDFLNIDPLDIYKLIKYSQKQDKFLTEILRDNDLSEIKLKDLEKIKEFFEKIVLWNRQSFNDPLNHLFVDILKKSGLLEGIMKDRKSVDVLDKFASLYIDIRAHQDKNPNFSLREFLTYLTLLESHNLSVKRSSKDSKRKGVRLMTAHKSKGLEFEHVFIINAFDGHWGMIRKKSSYFQIPWEDLNIKISGTEFDPLEDERRLFFVSITRAKKEIFITYSNKSLEGKDQQPSQFVNEIKDEYKENLDVLSFEEKFLSEKEKIFIEKKLSDSKTREKEFLESKDFFASLFYERGLSATGLNNYLECPWKFVFRNLLLLPDVKGKQQIFGSAIHFALCCYLRSPKRELLNEEFLIEKYLEYLSGETLIKRERLELEEKGKKVLSDYFNNVAKIWKGELKGEMDIRGIKFLDGVTLNGRLDMVEVLDKDTVRVYDFKTGKPKSRNQIEGLTQNSKGNYLNQLVFYKILIENFYNGKVKMNEGVIEFVESDSKGVFKREIFLIGDDQIKILEQEIKRVSDEIINLKFWKIRCEDKDCEYCILRSYIS